MLRKQNNLSHVYNCILYFIQYYVLQCIDPALKINISKLVFMLLFEVDVVHINTEEADGLFNFVRLVAQLATFHDLLNLTLFACVCVCVCACARARACVRACVRVCVCDQFQFIRKQ